MVKCNYLSMPLRSQRGSVLFVSIIMLVIITILSLTAMRSTMMQERMSGNLRDKNIAFQSAEMALRQAEKALEGGASYVAGTDKGYYEPDMNNVAAPNPADNAAWVLAAVMVGDTVHGATNAPWFFIEKLPSSVPLIPGEPVKTDQFRISARGTGGSTQTSVVLQSYFVRYR